MTKIDHSIYSIRFVNSKKSGGYLFNENNNKFSFFPNFNWRKRIRWFLLSLLAILLLYLLFSLIPPLFAKETYRGIVNQDAYEQIKDDRNVEVFPITSGLYEVVGTNPKIEDVAQIIERIIPITPPTSSNNCNYDLAFRHLDNLGYNQFVVEYINSILTGTVTIGVLDTGIDKDHAFLAGSIQDPVLVRDSFLSGDSYGHGTHIAGIIKQMNNRVTILPIKVSDGATNEISNIDFIKGLAIVSSMTGIDILNLSLGGYEFYEEEVNLINTIVGNNVLIIASAGNEGLDTTYTFPAGHKNVISVGSNDMNSDPSVFSNYDPNIRAPGECIYSTLPDNIRGFADGTSMAAPIVAGYLSFAAMEGIGVQDILGKYKQKNIYLEQESVANVLGISIESNSFVSALDSMLGVVSGIIKKTISLQQKLIDDSVSNIIAQKEYKALKNSIRSDVGKISQESKKIQSIYVSIGLTGGSSKILSETIDILSSNIQKILNFDSIILPVNELGGLMSSLGIDICTEKSGIPNGEYCGSSCQETNGMICGVFDPIIVSGSLLPFQSESSYVTIENYQQGMAISIYQGDRTFVKDTKKLGSIKINNLPSKLKGETVVNVVFSINKNGELSVRAMDDVNENNYQTTVIRQGIDYNITEDNSNSNLSDILSALSDIEDQLNDFSSYLKGLKVYRPTSEVSINIPIVPSIDKKSTLDIYSVVKIIDGDTVDLKSSLGDISRFRLIGINTPEYNTTRSISECYGEKAMLFLKDKIENKSVSVEYDETQGKYDKYGRELAYLFVGKENINQSLIEGGFAHEYTYNTPYKYFQSFYDAEEMAKNRLVGLRSECRNN